MVLLAVRISLGAELALPLVDNEELNLVTA